MLRVWDYPPVYTLPYGVSLWTILICLVARTIRISSVFEDLEDFDEQKRKKSNPFFRKFLVLVKAVAEDLFSVITYYTKLQK